MFVASPFGVFRAAFCFSGGLLVASIVATCGNCRSVIGNVPRPDGVPDVAARMLAGGCPDCLAFGPDRYFDAANRELDQETWQPVGGWRRVLRNLASARVPGAMGASMMVGLGAGMHIENGLLKGGGVRWKKAHAFGGEMKEPRFIVLHDTASRLSKFNVVNYFASTDCKVSAHFVVERDGTITQMVQTTRRAYHAGQSKWRGVTGINSCSIGIEIVNPGKLDETGKAWFGDAAKPSEIVKETTPNHGSGYWLPYTPAQIEAVILLCREIVEEYPDCNEIITHWMISPNRKIDVNPLFPLHEVRRRVLEPTPGEIEHAPDAAVAPLPPPPKPAKVPAPIKEAAKSKSAWTLLAVIWGYIVDFFFGLGQMVSDGLDGLVSVLKPAQAEAESTIAPLMSLTQTLQLNLGRIAVWGTIGILAVVLVRHVGKRVELAGVKEQLPEPPEAEGTPS